MAIGAIEMSTIARAQDYTTIKHNEDNKAFVDQNNIGQQVHKNVEELVRQVKSGDDTQWQNKKFDAKEKGSNAYSGDGGRKHREEKSRDRAAVKDDSRGFDIKI